MFPLSRSILLKDETLLQLNCRRSELSQIQDKHAAIRCTSAHFGALGVPANLKDAPGALIAVHQLSRLRAPNVHALVKATRGQMLTVRTERHRVYRFRVLGQRMDAAATLHIPQPHRRIERGRGEDQVGVGVVSSRARGRPFYRVDLLGVSLQVVTASVSVHAPDFQGHVVGTGGQQLALGTPLDGVHLVRVALEGFNWFVYSEPTYMDALISTAGCEGLIGLPVHIQGRSVVKSELLSALSGRGVPYDRRFVHSGRENVVAALVPLQRKDWTLVLAESGGQPTVRLPDPGVAVITTRSE